MTGQAEQLQSMMSFFKITGRADASLRNAAAKVPQKAERAKPALALNRTNANAEFSLSDFDRF
jgi:hypothetical protein